MVYTIICQYDSTMIDIKIHITKDRAVINSNDYNSEVFSVTYISTMLSPFANTINDIDVKFYGIQYNNEWVQDLRRNIRSRQILPLISDSSSGEGYNSNIHNNVPNIDSLSIINQSDTNSCREIPSPDTQLDSKYISNIIPTSIQFKMNCTDNKQNYDINYINNIVNKLIVINKEYGKLPDINPHNDSAIKKLKNYISLQLYHSYR